MNHADAKETKKQPTSKFLEELAQLFEDQGDHGTALLILDKAKLWSIVEEAEEIMNNARKGN